MRYDFSHTLTDEKIGIAIAYDLEVEIELSVSLDAGVPAVSVDGIYMDGHNLLNGTSLTQSIAAEIANAAESDDGLCERAIADAGFIYRGMGGNDPDGHYRRVS